MAAVTVALRNEANTSTTSALSDAFDVKFQVQRNGLGVGEFRQQNPPAVSVPDGSVVQFSVAGTARYAARVVSHVVEEASEGNEGAESTLYRCKGLGVDLAEVFVMPRPGTADLVPSIDERIWSWAAPGYSTGAWEAATELSTQGWAVGFYDGQPSGWTDPSAKFICPSDGTTSDAPAGVWYARQDLALTLGAYYLEWCADNEAQLFINGKPFGAGGDFRQKYEFQFECTTGDLTLAFKVTNAADDGPPGGNPTALIWSLRQGGPEGTVVARSSASMLVTDIGETPAEIPVGLILDDVLGDSAVSATWTQAGTTTADAASATYPTVERFTARFYEDSVLDVVEQLAEEHIDWKVAASGKTLSPYVKGTLDTPVTFDLVTGYSTAGVATPANVNVLDLSWDVRRAECSKIAVRWSGQWISVGSGTREKAVRAEQLTTEADAQAYATALLALYGVEQATASFEYLPLVEPDDLPFVAFDVFHLWPIPGPYNHDTTTEQAVWAITCDSDDDGELVAIVEVGSPIRNRIELLERAGRRGVATLGGLASGAGGRGPSTTLEMARFRTPEPAGTVVRLVSDPAPTTKTVTFSNSFVGLVNYLRLEGTDDGGTSTYEVTVGATTYTLTGTGSGLINVASVGVSWDTTTQITVECTAVGHTDVAIYADISRIT